MLECNDADGKFAGYIVDCPGCEKSHFFRVTPKAEDPVWNFDGNVEQPTFIPSLRSMWRDSEGEQCCHFFLKNGVFEFCSDSTHNKAGQHIPIV